MNKEYYDATVTMEKEGVLEDYIMGWQNGYLVAPPREEQRASDAYTAGYGDGKKKNKENYKSWIKKS